MKLKNSIAVSSIIWKEEKRGKEKMEGRIRENGRKNRRKEVKEMEKEREKRKEGKGKNKKGRKRQRNQMGSGGN